jgi:nitrogen regulatory protein PII
MKRVAATIGPVKLDEVREALQGVGITGMTVSAARSVGRTGIRRVVYGGSTYVVDFVTNVLVEIVTPDNLVPAVINAIHQSSGMGKTPTGHIFVSDIVEVVRIRTGEHGEEAL